MAAQDASGEYLYRLMWSYLYPYHILDNRHRMLTGKTKWMTGNCHLHKQVIMTVIMVKILHTLLATNLGSFKMPPMLAESDRSHVAQSCYSVIGDKPFLWSKAKFDSP